MKKLILLSSLVILAASCNKTGSLSREDRIPSGGEDGLGTVAISLTTESAATKAEAYTSLTDAERRLTDIQVVIFNAAGVVERLLTTEDFTISGNSASSGDVSLSVGNKTVYAIVNGPSVASMTKAQIDALTVGLAEYNDRGTDFIQFASASTVVSTSGKAPVSLRTRRPVSRVTLVELNNSLISGRQVTRAYAFIANGVKEATMSTLAGKTSYVNIGGYVSGSAIDGSAVKAESEGMTAFALPSSIANGSSWTGQALTYSYATPSGGSDAWLVVAAEIDGVVNYYNVRLGALAANTAYTVALTIRNFGSDEPCTDNETGTATMTITSESWTDGGLTETTI